MRRNSGLKKLKRFLAVALALALLFNGWSNYDLSVKADNETEQTETTETVENNVEGEETVEEDNTETVEETVTTEETQTVEESQTTENSAATEETATTEEVSTETESTAETEETAKTKITLNNPNAGISAASVEPSGNTPMVTAAGDVELTITLESNVTGGELEYTTGSPGSLILTPTATSDDPTFTDPGNLTYDWVSSDEDVVEVHGGVVTAAGKGGTATITATVNTGGYTGSGTYTVTVVAENSITGLEINGDTVSVDGTYTGLTYGDANTSFSVNATSTDGDISYTVSDTSIAVVDSNNKSPVLTIYKAGTFNLKVSIAASTYYKEASEVSFTFEVQKYSLEVSIKAGQSITKTSDGKTALSDGNKTSLAVISSYVEPSNLVNSDRNIKLDLDTTSVAQGTDIWTSVTYYYSDLSSNNYVSGFESIVNYLTLSGTNAENYEISSSSLADLQLPASITAFAPNVGEDEYDMTTTAGTNGEVVIEITIEGVSRPAITLAAGTAGNGSYWYNKEGCNVTLSKDFALVASDGSSSVSTPFTADSTEFYITYTNGSGETTYYGTYTVKIQRDETEPSITVTGVEAYGTGSGSSLTDPLYSKTAVKYTLTVSDGDSGVDSVYYYLRTTDSGDVTADTSGWQEINLGTDGTFTVTVPAHGYLYVKAIDKVENTKVGGSYCLLVLEDKEPTLTVTCDTKSTGTANPQQSHTISVTVKDEDDSTSGTTYSGIQTVYYTLVKSGSTVSDPDQVSLYAGTKASTLSERVQSTTISDITLTASDGTYTLTVYAVDWCGNTSSQSITLDFDTKSPELAVSFGSANTYENNVGYYNTAFDVTFTVTDNYPLDADKLFPGVLKDSASYTLTWTEEASSSADSNGQYTYSAKATLPNTTEGEFAFLIVGTDYAGNELADETTETGENVVSPTQTSDGDGFVSGTKVMDITAPTVTAVACEQEAKGDNGAAYSDGNFYYNDDTVTLTFTLSDAYLPATSSNWANSESITWTFTPIGSSSSQSGSTTGTYTAGSGTATVQFSLSAEGTYSGISLSGKDLAGNYLTIGDESSYTHETCNTSTAKDNAVVLTYGKVIDRTAPEAVITYSSSATGYIYGSSDDNAGKTGAVYYNDDVTVNIGITDQYALDDTKLWTTENGGDGVNVSAASASYTVSGEDGTYYYGVYGTDRAGNALTVTEVIATPNSEGSEVSSEEQTECEIGYESQYEIVLDQTAPTFVLTIDRSGATNQALQNNRYYFNSSYTATVEVTETNFDSDRIAVNCARGEATGTSAVTFDEDDYTASNSWDVEGDNPVWEETVSDEGVYRYMMSGEDKAGNALICVEDDHAEIQDTDSLLSYYIEVDTTAPAGTLTVNDYYEIDIASGSLAKSEPYRDETSATVKITTSDLSPVLIGYTINSTVKSAITKSAGYGYQQSSSTLVSGEQIFTVKSITVTDRAGNKISLGTTNGIYLDVTAPTMDTLAPTISVEAEAEDSHNGDEGTPLFSRDVPLHIVVTDPYGGTKSSGLSTVTYQLYINGSEVTGDAQTLNPTSTTSWSNNYSDPTLTFTIDRTITVDADDHNYNDIEVVVKAVDNAGNANTRTYSFGIDTTAPTIEITYDNNDAENEKYFKAARIATIVVTERNFNSDLIEISTESRVFSGWDYEAGSSSNGDDDTWTATIAYNVDGDYTLNVSGEDLLGHEADVTYNGTAPQEFTIDMTAPILELTFDNNNVSNGKYYNASRTATLTVTDVNFAGTSDIAVLASGGGVAPSFNFAGGYTSSATFGVDGIYSFSGTVTDLAGNVSLPVSCDEFVIDQTAPEIIFHAVENMTAYGKGEIEDENIGDVFAPYITIEDTNYDSNGVSVTLTRSKWDEIDEEVVDFGTLRGMTYYLNEIEETVDNDAVYTLTVTVTDLAGNGNDALEGSRTFSLNRFGSVYILSEETADLIEQYYTNEEPTLTLTEYNLSNAEETWIDVTRGGEDSAQLVEDEDYTATLSGDTDNDCNWKKTDYEILSSNFTEDGAYTVLLYTKDTKANATTNESQGYLEYATTIDFCKDTEGPSLTVTGVEEGESYNASSMPLLVSYFDNNEMESVTISVVERDDETVVLGEASYKVVDGTLELISGEIDDYVLSEHNRWQKVIVTAYDSAGNASQESITCLLTTNNWIRFYNNKPLFYGTIGGIALLAALLLFLILWKRRKKEDEEEGAK